jgi:hypothetical protein
VDIRKLAIVAGFAAGAAVTFAPLASADSLSGVVDSEIAGENSLFQLEALLAGVPSTDYSLVDGFDVINAADIATDTPSTGQPSILDYELFGVKPFTAGVASDPGSYNVFNGAVTKFDDAYNVLLYAAENHGDLLPVSDVFGNHLEFVTGAGATAASAFENFWNFGVGDLSGFFQIDLSAFDISSSTATALFSLFG